MPPARRQDAGATKRGRPAYASLGWRGTMLFLHPIAIAIGAGLLALPVAVHLLTRPRPVRFPFSALRFLESALKQRRFFARLRDAILLVLRAALLAVIALAFARPLLEGPARAAPKGLARRVVILDCSRSMDARRGGIRVFDRARAMAQTYVRRTGTVRTNLILAGAQPRAVFDEFSTNYPALDAEVRRAEVRQEELDAKGALARAAQLLAAPGRQPGGTGQVVVVTDLQETNWRDLAASQVPAGVDVRIEYVGLGTDAGNLSVTDVSPVGAPRRGGPLPLRVEVGNFSRSDQSRTVELTANGRVYRREAAPAAYGHATLTFDLPADVAADGPDAGWVCGQARLIEARDALPDDDARPFAIRLGEAPVYALVSREDPRHVGNGAYFVWRMLSPGGQERVVPVDAAAPDASALATADMVVVEKPGRLGPDAVQLLSGMLMRGCPVLYFAADEQDAQDLDMLAQACGTALAMPVQFGLPTGATGATGPALTLGPVRGSEQPFRSFGGTLQQLTAGLAVRGVLRTQAPAGEPPEGVLASWSDGSAALVTARAGNGRLVVWNADLLSSTLPRSGFFVALVRELAGELLADRYGLAGALPPGTARLLPLPPQAERASALKLLGPDGKDVTDFDVEERDAGLTWRWAPVAPPGVYRVVRSGQTVLAAASACPAGESDLRPAQEGAVTAALSAAGTPPGARRVTVVGLPGSRERTADLDVWPYLIVGAIGIMLLELATLKLFRI